MGLEKTSLLLLYMCICVHDCLCVHVCWEPWHHIPYLASEVRPTSTIVSDRVKGEGSMLQLPMSEKEL